VLINWLVHAPTTDIDIQLVVFENPENTEDAFITEAEKAGLSVKKIPWSRSKPVFKSARALDRLLKEHGTQILHTHNAYAEMVGLIAGKRQKLKLVSTIYVWAGKDFGVKRYLLQKLGAAIIKRFDLLTVQCEKARDESTTWGTIIVCNVARLYPEKGQARMLQIWRRIVNQCPNAVLWIYGVGPLQNELEELTRELSLNDSVVFKGFASNLMDELELCDVQLHTSFNEGVPIAICAGMATGLPIEDKTIELIRNPDMRKMLGNGAKSFIENEYSMSAAVTILVDTYRALLK